MRYTIRKGIYETNSSSMHTIAITDDDEYYTHDELIKEMGLIDGKGVWDLSNTYLTDKDIDGAYGNYFGRGYGKDYVELNTFTGKFLYAVASCCSHNRLKGGRYVYDKKKNDRIYNGILEVVKKRVPELKNIILPKVAESSYSTTEYKYGFVDHQSIGIIENYLDREYTMDEFLFNKRYSVIVTSDEADDTYPHEFINNHRIMKLINHAYGDIIIYDEKEKKYRVYKENQYVGYTTKLLDNTEEGDK